MLYQVHLSPDQLRSLRSRMKKERDAKILRRLQCIDFAAAACSNQDIARFLHVTPDTVTNWLRLFSVEGLVGICTLRYDGRRPSKLDAHKEELRAHVKAGKASKLAELQHYIQTTWGLVIEQSWLSRYCKKNSILPTRRLA
jgi:transposase